MEDLALIERSKPKTNTSREKGGREIEISMVRASPKDSLCFVFKKKEG